MNTLLINKTSRVFNSIRPNEVTEVNEVNLDTYLTAGFERLSTETIKNPEAPVVEQGLTVAKLKELLKEKGIEIPKGAVKADLEKLLADSEVITTVTIDGIEEFKKLLTDNAIPFNTEATVEELKALCEENGLI